VAICILTNQQYGTWPIRAAVVNGGKAIRWMRRCACIRGSSRNLKVCVLFASMIAQTTLRGLGALEVVPEYERKVSKSPRKHRSHKSPRGYPTGSKSGSSTPRSDGTDSPRVVGGNDTPRSHRSNPHESKHRRQRSPRDRNGGTADSPRVRVETPRSMAAESKVCN